LIHVLVEGGEIFAEIINGNPRDAGNAVIRGLLEGWRGGEVGDAFAKNADVVAHDVNDGAFYSKEKSVEVLLADAVTDLASESRIELIFGDGAELGAIGIGARIFGIESHVERLGGDVYFIDLLPRPFEIWATWGDDADLGVGVAPAFLRLERLGDGIIEGCLVAKAFGSSEDGFHGSFVLVDGVKPCDEVAHEKPSGGTNEKAEEDLHKG